MKKFIFALTFAVIALIAPQQVSAYSQELADLVTELNKEMAGSDGVQSLKYDGNDLIITMSGDIFSNEEFTMMKTLAQQPEVMNQMMAPFLQDIFSDDSAVLIDVLKAYNAGLVFKFVRGSDSFTFPINLN